MATPGEELATLDFESMIGGPLLAVVNAQAQAAMSTVDFIKSVGFEEDSAGGIKPIAVTFGYERDFPVADSSGNVTLQRRNFNLTVPILTMLPIPFLRVEEATIDFNAKIVSVQYRDTASTLNFSTELKAKAGFVFGSAQLKTNFSYQRTNNEGSKVERTYTMGVHVRAVQDEMPAGTERLLGILENSIQEAPLTSGSTTPP